MCRFYPLSVLLAVVVFAASCTSRCMNPIVEMYGAKTDTIHGFLQHMVMVKYDRGSNFGSIKGIISAYDTIYSQDVITKGDTTITGFDYAQRMKVDNYDWIVYFPERNKIYKVRDITFDTEVRKLGLSRECSNAGSCYVNDSLIAFTTAYDYLLKHGRTPLYVQIILPY